MQVQNQIEKTILEKISESEINESYKVNFIEKAEEFLKNLSNNYIYENTLMSVKFVAVILIVINFITKYFNKNIDDKQKLPFNWSDLLRPLFYVCCICSFNILLGLLDGLIETFFDTPEKGKVIYQKLFTEGLKSLKKMEITDEEVSIGINPIFWIKSLLMNFINFLLSYLLGAWDMILYVGYLADRYFLLAVSNLIFPFLLALSALDLFKNLIIKGIKGYLAIHISFYVLYLGMNIGDQFFNFICSYEFGDDLGKVRGTISAFFTILLFGLFSIYTKYKLIKSGFSYLYKITS